MAEILFFLQTNLEMVITVWSFVTIGMLWLFTILCLVDFSILGIYLLLLALCTTTIECSKFVQRFMCCPESSIPYKMFQALLWLNTWKRALFYLVATLILLFMVILNLWSLFLFIVLAGLAGLYFYQWYASRNQSNNQDAEKGFDGGAAGGPPPANPAASGYSGY